MNSTASIETSTIPSEPNLANGALQYRALSPMALISLLLGLLSSTILFSADDLASCLAMAPIPVVGMFVSLRAWLSIRRQRDLYTGAPIALLGLALATLFLFVGISRASYTYATEVPEGYVRISFYALKPDEIEERASKPIPDDIAPLIGKRVFIKGYIRPDSILSRNNINKFLLVRDNNTCCFGDLSKVKFFDQIDVVLVAPLRVDYRKNIFRVGGTLYIDPASLGRGDGSTFYKLVADHVQ